MNTVKNIGAVLSGIIFIFVTHSVTDRILEGLGIFPPPDQGLHTTWMVVTALVYRVLFSVAAAFLTAALAPSRPMFHALVLGVIGLVLSTVAAIAVIPMNLSPSWYPVALAVSALPAAWLGGIMYTSTRLR